jgi:hypothetical protein
MVNSGTRWGACLVPNISNRGLNVAVLKMESNHEISISKIFTSTRNWRRERGWPVRRGCRFSLSGQLAFLAAPLRPCVGSSVDALPFAFPGPCRSPGIPPCLIPRLCTAHLLLLYYCISRERGESLSIQETEHLERERSQPKAARIFKRWSFMEACEKGWY